MAVFVKQKPKENADKLLKRFNEKMKASKVLQNYLDMMYYTKKSTKKRIKRYASIKRNKIKQSSTQ